jgi:hypothetical protein
MSVLEEPAEDIWGDRAKTLRHMFPELALFAGSVSIGALSCPT